MMTNANAAIAVLEEIKASERDSNTRPLRYRCKAFPSELGFSKVGRALSRMHEP